MTAFLYRFERYLEILLVTTALAFLGNVSRTALAARLSGEPWPTPSALARWSQTKGLMEPVVLTVLRGHHDEMCFRPFLDGGAEHDARDAADASCAAPHGLDGGIRYSADDPSALRLAGRSKPRDLDRWKPHGKNDGFAQRLP